MEDEIKKPGIIRYIIGGILIIVILIAGLYFYNHKEKILENERIITYGDGCKEVYRNDKLITDKCINAREEIAWEIVNKKLMQTINQTS